MTIANNAALNIEVHISFQICVSVFFRYSPETNTVLWVNCTSVEKKKIVVYYLFVYSVLGASQVVQEIKNLLANAGNIRDEGSIPGLGRSPGGGYGNPL